MLVNTFQHIAGIGPHTEQFLWASGVKDWQSFLSSTNGQHLGSPGIQPTDKRQGRHQFYRESREIMEGSSGVRREVMESLRRLQARDSAYFQRRLPSRERWRLYREFRHQAAFLDIETTGISPNGSDIILVGLFDGRSYRGFVKGQNMHLLPVALARYKLIVTYNGAIFDLPFIQSQLGPLFQHHAHIDLRYPLGRLGYRGGLKVIESQLSIQRAPGIGILDGQDAVTLWREHRKGNRGALPTLIRYNAEDVLSLPDLADLAYNALSHDLRLEVPPLQSLPKPSLNLPYDIQLCRWVKGQRLATSF